MKVTHFYSGNMYGGVEVLLENFKRFESACPEMKPSYILCFEGTLSKQLRKHGAELKFVSAPTFRKPWTVLRARAELKKQLTELPPDVLVCHEMWNYAIAAPVARAMKIPLVIWHHNPPSISWLRYFVKFYQPDLAITCSQYVAQNMKGIVPERLVHPCNSILPPPESSHPDNRLRVRHQYGAAEGDVVIVCVTRLAAYKGQQVLVSAAALLKDLPFRIWITGRPATNDERLFLESLVKQCKETGLEDKVRFLGFVDNVRDLYAAADIYCQPNISPEPYGLTFIEALYAGLPVVSTGIGGTAEILNDGQQAYGITVPPRNHKKLADELRELINNEPLRHSFRKSGPLRAQKLGDPHRAVNAVADLLMPLLKGSARKERDKP